MFLIIVFVEESRYEQNFTHPVKKVTNGKKSGTRLPYPCLAQEKSIFRVQSAKR